MLAFDDSIRFEQAAGTLLSWRAEEVRNMGQTIAEKILSRKSRSGKPARAGQIIEAGRYSRRRP
jgi:hypothetical protein